MRFYQNLSWKFLQLTYGNFAKRYFNIECIKHQDEPDPPFILLANHYYHTDPFFISAFLKTPVHYLGSDEMASLSQQILGHLVGLVYTHKGMIDTKAMRALLKYIKKGDGIALFPEGDGSWDGETDNIPENIIKLIKKLEIPIVTVNVSGGYLTKSRWAKKFRRGKIILQFRVISKREIKDFTNDELYRIIKSHLYNNDIKNKDIQKIEFRGKKLAQGIQYLLWKCPKCNKEDTIYEINNKIACNECKTVWTLDENMKVMPIINEIKDIKDWSDWQKKEIRKMIKVKEIRELTKTSNVKLNIFSRYSKGINRKKMIFDEYSKGGIVLEKENLIFLPFDKNKKRIDFKVKDIKSYVDCMNKFFRFNYESKIYQLVFYGKNSSKYICFLRELQKADKQKNFG